MEIRHYQQQKPFTTKDGSTIRSLLDKANAPVANQSLAEATLPAGGTTQRHYHRLSEEFYYLLAGRGLMAPRADGGGTLARSHEDLYALVVGSESGLVVDESPEAVAAI